MPRVGNTTICYRAIVDGDHVDAFLLATAQCHFPNRPIAERAHVFG